MKSNFVKIGEVYNNRRVLVELEPKKYGKKRCSTRCWQIECCNCGTKIIATNCDIKRSSGCKTCKGLPKGVIGFKKLYRSYLFNAKGRNLDFALTEDQFKTIVQSTCHYCGVQPFGISRGDKTTGFWTNFIYNGIDRMDNRKGYSLDNCVPCCCNCNHAKCDKTYDEFIKYLDCIALFRSKY